MTQIPLTKSMFATVDDEDALAVCFEGQWYYHNKGYAARSERRGGKHLILLHVFIAKRMGIWKPECEIDHKNLDKLDCRRGNLRQADRGINSQNRVAYNATGFKGVRSHGLGYRAEIRFDGKSKHLGTFLTPELAAMAYDKAAREHHGEHATVNFPHPR